MDKLVFPHPYRHEHPPVQNVYEVLKGQLTLGHRASDWVARTVGSWRFILLQSSLLAGWVVLNVTAYVRHWDPYPFILMNLLLSLQAAYTAPIIMMSQNRLAMHDRLAAQHDYWVNEKAEKEVRHVLEHLAAQDRALEAIHRLLLERAPASTPGGAEVRSALDEAAQHDRQVQREG